MGTWVSRSSLPPIVRDSVCLVLGAGMLVFMAVTHYVPPILVGAALVCLGITGRSGIRSLLRLAAEEDEEDTDGSTERRTPRRQSRSQRR